jgi:multicomponent K+:H+ antiporter subunit D
LAFATLAISVAGAPPLAGFLGKVMLMQSMSQDAFGSAYWALLVLSGFVSALVLARAASIYFWERDSQPDVIVARRLRRSEILALLFFAAVGPLQVIGSGPLADYARAAAEQLHARQPYISAVLGNSTEILRARRP